MESHVLSRNRHFQRRRRLGSAAGGSGRRLMTPAPGRVVVLGGGIASVRLAEGLRRHGYSGTVTIVAGETTDPYDRPQLSKRLLVGGAPDAPLMDRASALALDIDLRVGRRAVALDADARHAVLDDGTAVRYDAAVIATGARPRSLAALNGERVHTLRTLDDTRHLRADILQAKCLTIVGGGFIGSEVAASARSVGAAVTLVESLSGPIARVVGSHMAQRFTDAHTLAGVDLRLGQSVLGSSDHDGGRSLLVENGFPIPAELLLVAVGVTPDTDWLEGSGLDVDDGVVCDAWGRASMDGVWSMGDVARWYVPSIGRPRRFEHWTSAADQAEVIAFEMAVGHAPAHEPVPYVWSDQYGVRYQIVGTPDSADDVRMLADEGPASFLAVYSRNDRLTAAFSAGMPRPVAKLRRLLTAGTDVAAAAAGVGL